MIIDAIVDELCKRLNGKMVVHYKNEYEIVFAECWYLLSRSCNDNITVFYTKECPPPQNLKLSNPNFINELELVLDKNIKYLNAYGNSLVSPFVIFP